MRHRTVRTTACLVGLLAAAVHADGPIDAVHINFAPAHPQVRTFDRMADHPREVGGQRGEMKSITKTDVSIRYSYTYQTACLECGCQVAVTVRSVTIEAQMNSTVFVPNDATRPVKDHEQAHYDLDAYAYAQARRKALVYGMHFVGSFFIASNENDARAQAEAAFNREFTEAFQKWRAQLHQAYNDMESRGRLAGLSEPAAVQHVIDRFG